MALTEKAVRASLNLPRTAFPMRAAAATREAPMAHRLTTQLYRRHREQCAAAVAASAGNGDVQAGASRRKPFVLHDGPPYANGALHMGHYLNKVLKDVTNRIALLQGRDVTFVPGWDCHGLPIELKALVQAGGQAETGGGHTGMDPVEIRRLAQECALEAIAEQREDLVRWGIMADWSGAEGAIYRTMDKEYEAAQLEVFKRLVDGGHVYRGKKPVYWSPSSKTALAEAELEYQDNHISPSAYIAFPFDADAVANHDVLSRFPGAAALIWTTTPWTIPANMALAMHADFEYSIVAVPATCTAVTAPYLVVVTDRLDEVARLLGSDGDEGGAAVEVVAIFSGSSMRDAGTFCRHPLFPDRKSVVFCAEHVTADSGTGIVHTAPGHGHEDFLAAKDLGLEPLCPVDDEGRFTQEAGDAFVGLPVQTAGNKAVLEALTDAKALLHTEKFSHRYPYDWRTKQPVIIRATEQWFANVEHLHSAAVDALSTVTMTPSVSRHRLEAMVSSRTEWCISRQRSWGVPIPVLYDTETGEALLSNASLSHISNLVSQHGTDCWWSLPVEELLAPEYRDNGRTYERGTDTLDVWFDSGTSWASSWAASANAQRPAGDARLSPWDTYRVADVVLEGSDQHRGWFQSSLLVGVAAMGQAPYKNIVTHGFVLDEFGFKMSKSQGNVIAPNDIILGTAAAQKLRDALEAEAVATAQLGKRRDDESASAGGGDASASSKKKKKKKKQKKKKPAARFDVGYGADVARLWAASADYSKDVLIGSKVVASTSETLRKFRNTARFLLGNLDDYRPLTMGLSFPDVDVSNTASDGDLTQKLQAMWGTCPSDGLSSHPSLHAVDVYMLTRLAALNTHVQAAFSTFNYSKAMQLLNHFVTVELSSFYLDVCKDRLYADASDAQSRRACQAVLFEALRVMTLLAAPVVPYTSDDIFRHSLPLVGHEQLPDDAFLDIATTVFDAGFVDPPPTWDNAEVTSDWTTIMSLREQVNRVLETARKERAIGSPLEASVAIEPAAADVPSMVMGVLGRLPGRQLADICLTSQAFAGVDARARSAALAVPHSDGVDGFEFTAEVEVSAGEDGSASEACIVQVAPARGTKCMRCWQFTVASDAGNDLCGRCASVLGH